MTTQDIMTEFRVTSDYKYDPWGAIMDFGFAVCSEMYFRGIEVPDRMRYSPGAMSGDPRETDSYWFEPLIECCDDTLYYLCNLVHYYSEFLVIRGMDY